jgi:hypothetical protein
MTETHIFYQEFMSAIRNKIQHKATLTNTITDLLEIDKDAAYRRLRGEVNFSFAEMAVIARNMGISLDAIAGIENMRSKPSKMNISRQVNPTEVDYEMFEAHVNLLKSIKDEPATKFMGAGNMLPHYLYMDYEYLTRLYLFMWNQGSGYGDARPYHEITIPERLRVLQKEACRYAKHISSTLYVFDHLIFQRLIADIKYFVRVRLIKEDDVAIIKTDLTEFLHNLENMTIKGKHEETGNEVSIFISDIDCDSNYSCLKSSNIQLTLFLAFVLNAIESFDDEIFNETCAWIHSLQRMSTLISVSGEKPRAMFFSEQHKIIDTL